uniref:Uncharacterized protein n=1 Tax=Ananas comosus var. bracteatus TaxID=296719 RepID=A0A6V7Q4W9_ANACO|nr:unnamed protein product [Ananas comosus var. bracteatus]
MPSPSLPPPSNAVSNDRPLKITIKLGAGRALYKSRAEAPPVEHEKVPAKRARADAASEGSRPLPIPSAEGPHGVEAQVLAIKPPRRHIRGPSERYQSSKAEARADADATDSKGKSSNKEDQLRPAEAAQVLPGRRPPQAKDAGQSSSTAAKKIAFSLALTKEEIIEDFTAMRLPLPARRPKKVPNSRFKHLFPGSGLPKSVTPGRYTVKARGSTASKAEKSSAERGTPEAGREESRTIPNYRTDHQYAVEQVHADCVPPPPAKRHRRHISRLSKRYRNSEKEADDPPSVSRGKSSSVENRLVSSMQMPMLCQTHDMQGRQPAKDAGQSLSTTKKATFSLAMTKEEIIEDLTAMRLLLPMRRLRRERNSRFKHLFPGSGFPKAVTPGRCTVKGRRNG